jgi:hypothetical protein
VTSGQAFQGTQVEFLASLARTNEGLETIGYARSYRQAAGV